MARSALMTSVSTVVPSFGKIEIPMLVLILRLTSWPRTLTLNGA